MTKHASCAVLIMFAKTVHAVAAGVPVRALAVQKPAAVSSRKASHSAVRWAPMQRILALAHHVAMHVPPSVKNARITLVRAMTITATAPKLHESRALQEIVRKVIDRHFKIAVHVRREIAHKGIVRLTRTVARVHREIVRKATVRIKIAARVHRARPTPTRPNFAAGMCPMVLIPAHA